MALPHLRFVWSPRRQEADWRLGLFGSFRPADGGSPALAVSLRGVLRWGLALGGVAYFAGAAALWSWLDRKPYNFVTYPDLVLPTRWSRLEALRGEATIQEALDNFRAQKWAAALKGLEIGLSRDPDTTKGRLELAALKLALNDRRSAEEILRAGLKHGYAGRPYLAEVCRVAAQGENYALWLFACDTALAQLAGQPQLATDRQWLVRQKLSALLAAGRNDEAVHLAGEEGETRSDIMREFKVLALLKDGRPAAAVDFLSDWRSQVSLPGEVEQVRRLQVRAFREAGRLDDMDRALEELRAATPRAPAPYAYAIIQRLLAGQRPPAETTFQDYLGRFSGQPANLDLLAEPLAEIAEEPLLERLLDRARAQGFNLLSIQRALVVAAMKNGHWSDASALLTEMKPRLPPNDPTGLLWLNLMSRTVTAALDPSEGAQAGLVDFLSPRHLPIRLYRDAVEGLRQAGRLMTARQILTLALGVYPDNAPLRESAAELDRTIAQLPKPAAPAPSAAVTLTEAGEAPFFAALNAAMQAGEAAGALDRIRTARTAPPPWLAAREDELRRDEILLTARLHDTTALATAASVFLDGSDTRSLATVTLAQQLHAGDTRPESLQLLQLVLRKTPGFPPALRQLAAWAPPGPAAAPAPPATPVVTATRPPPATPAADSGRPPTPGEADFLQSLAAAMKAGDPSAALAQILEIRTARPAWLAAHEQELRGDEVLLNGRRHDDVAMLTDVRLLLNSSTARSLTALELAKQLHSGDTLPESLLVVQEVLRKTPGFPPATRLLAEWQPPPPAN